MRAAIVENGIVTNVVEVESIDVIPGLLEAESSGNIGDIWNGSAFIPKDQSALLTKEQFNAPILAQLDWIDSKSIRALREGDVFRINDLEAQAAALRLRLRK